MVYPAPSAYVVPSGMPVYAGRYRGGAMAMALALDSVAAAASLAGLPDSPWAPAAGAAASIGYASGGHPGGLLATLTDASPEFQSWNPLTHDGYAGPWAGLSPSARYLWTLAGVYGGGAWCETQRKFAIVGSGHVSPCVPVPVAFDVGTLAWSWLAVPVPSDGFSKINHPAEGAAAATVAGQYPADQFNTARSQWQGGYSGWTAGYGRPGEVFPETGHAFSGGPIWLPGPSVGNTNGKILYIARPTGNTGGSDMANNSLFNLDTDLWAATATDRIGIGNTAGGACFHAGINKVFAMTHDAGSPSRNLLDVYAPGSETWTSTTCTAAIPLHIESGGLKPFYSASVPAGLLLNFCPEDSGGNATYVSAIRHRIYAVDAMVAAAGSHTWTQLSVSAPSWPLRGLDSTIQTINWCFCSRNSKFYAVDGKDGSTTLWVLAPPAGATTVAALLAGTWTITTETFSVGLVSKNLSGAAHTAHVYNRLVYDDASRCLLFFPEWGGSRPQAIHPSGI